MTASAAGPRLVIFDLDGVVYRGSQPVPGIAATIERLERSGVGVRFATNNSTADRVAYVSVLAGMGIRTEADRVVTSTSATVAHLRLHLPAVRSLLAVGGAGMVDELRAAGFTVTPAAAAVPEAYDGGPLPARHDAVVVGLDRTLTYDRIAAAMTAVREGALLIATNADERYPTASGFLPGAGAVVAALRAATGVEPLVIGKPEPAMFASILERAGIAAQDALVVGDNPAADIVAASRAGIPSVLVLTGVTDAAAATALEGERRPDVILSSAAELPDHLGLP